MNKSPWLITTQSIWHSSRLAAWVLAVVLVGSHDFAMGQVAAGDKQKLSDDREVVDGLRRRRLFEIAEFYCRDQLAQPTIDPTSQSTLVIELMKTQTTNAVLSDVADRAAAWQAVKATSTEFERTNPDHPRIFLVQVQQALSHIAHGRLLRQELDAEMAADSARVEALTEIRTARLLLGNLQRDIAKAIPDQRGRSLTEHELSSEQLLNLNNNVQYQLAVCNLNRAQLYEASDRLNRIDALNSVSQRLTEVQRSASEGQPLWWKTKLGQIECLRLLGASANARLLAESLTRKKVPISTLLLLLEQKARVAIELGNEEYSRTILTEFNDLNIRTAQLELAIIELAVDLAARALTEERKREWIAFAAELSGTIERTYGGYWGRRADLILISATGVADNGSGTSDPVRITNSGHSATDTSNNVKLNLLIRLANEAARKELLDDALKAYGRAARLALSLNETEQALRMDFRAGKILEQQGKHGLAAERLTASAIRNERLRLAPSAHLIGCWNFAKSIQNNQPEGRKQFEKLLLDHLHRWSSGSSADQARIWLASEFQADQKWHAAFDVYLQVANDSPFLKQAIEQGIACANRVLLARQKAGSATQPIASQLTGQLSQKLRSLQKTDPIAAQLQLAQAELDLVFGSRQPNANLTKSLELIEVAGQEALANTARAIHAVSVVITEPETANQLVNQIAGDERALSLCERCLAAVLDNPAIADRAKNVNSLRLVVIETALSIPSMQQPVGATRRTSWMLRQSAALTALDRHSESIVVLKELEKKFPRNAGVQMQLGRAMSLQYGKTDPQKPLDKWRRIATRLKSHSSNWYEAKYEVARLLFESGDSIGATKLLKFIQANPPGWDNSPLKPKFEQLLRKCEGK